MATITAAAGGGNWNTAGTWDVGVPTAADDVVAVAQDDSDLPAKCTVNVTFGGTSIGTKTFTFQGIPTKVTVSDVTVGANSAYGYYRVTVADSAGNLLPSVKISASSTNLFP